jgi:hypothetical protein
VGIASFVGDCTDDALATSVIGTGFPGGYDPAQSSQVGCSTTDTFIGKCCGSAQEQSYGFFVGDIV